MGFKDPKADSSTKTTTTNVSNTSTVVNSSAVYGITGPELNQVIKTFSSYATAANNLVSNAYARSPIANTYGTAPVQSDDGEPNKNVSSWTDYLKNPVVIAAIVSGVFLMWSYKRR